METSAQLLYLLQHFDVEKKFGFQDELEQSEVIQWLFFWHGSGAPYQGNMTFFRKAQEQSSCKSPLSSLSFPLFPLPPGDNSNFNSDIPISQSQSPASAKKLSASSAFSNCSSQVNTRAKRKIISREEGRENIRSRIWGLGPGWRIGGGVGLRRRRWVRFLVCWGGLRELGRGRLCRGELGGSMWLCRVRLCVEIKIGRSSRIGQIFDIGNSLSGEILRKVVSEVK